MSQPLSSAAQKILSAVDLKFEDIHIPEWDLTVRIRQMNAGLTRKFTDAMAITEPQDGMYVIVIFTAHTTNTPDEERIFTYDTPEELYALIEQLKTKSMNVLRELQTVAMRVNGMGVEGQAALKKA